MKAHHLKQREVIDQIEKQIKTNSLQISTVTPIENFENDNRICLTSVHLPHTDFLDTIQKSLINPLQAVESSCYFYSNDSLHMTIKNIRVVSDPPLFITDDIKNANEVFNKVIPRHQKFTVHFYRLLLFPNNLALMGTADEERDAMFLDLDKEMKAAGIPDDKFYTNKKYFFINMTLARFSSVSDEFKQTITKLTHSFSLPPYTIDSVTLLTSNVVLKKLTIINTWQLQ